MNMFNLIASVCVFIGTLMVGNDLAWGWLLVIAGIATFWGLFDLSVKVPESYTGMPKVAIIGAYHIYSHSSSYSTTSEHVILEDGGRVSICGGFHCSQGNSRLVVLHKSGKVKFPETE